MLTDTPLSVADVPWMQDDAIALACSIEAVAPNYGCHVALTGGLLYKDGPRKDADFLFYRIRQVDSIDMDGLFAALKQIGIVKTSGFGWCHKAKFDGKPMDLFFPEEEDGEYERADPNDLLDPDRQRDQMIDDAEFDRLNPFPEGDA